jgi:hypothetical protein
MAYERDILDEYAEMRAPTRYPEVEATLGLVVEDRYSGFCGDVVKTTSAAVTLRGRSGDHRHFRWSRGGFLLAGQPVTLVAPVAARPSGPALTASGSVASTATRAKQARASRIWVEGKHDAELVEHVWARTCATWASWSSRWAASMTCPPPSPSSPRRPPVASASSSTTWSTARRRPVSPPACATRTSS